MDAYREDYFTFFLMPSTEKQNVDVVSYLTHLIASPINNL